MCTSTPKVAKAPDPPETVKVPDEEQVKARQTARSAAIRRYGAGGTDVTHGTASLSDGSAMVKQRTLGA